MSSNHSMILDLKIRTAIIHIDRGENATQLKFSIYEVPGNDRRADGDVRGEISDGIRDDRQAWNGLRLR